MAGAGQLVTHEPIHDLESFFYVLVSICILLDGPYKPKCDKDLAHCFNKYFNTFEPSILKMITMQSDLTWKLFILQHISTYFEPIIDLLTRLHDAIIVPLSTNDHGNVRHSQSFTHDMFIANIIQTLSHLDADVWISVDQANSHNSDSNLKVQVKELAGMTNEESPPTVTVTNEKSPLAVTVTNEESPSSVTENQLYAKSIVPVMASALPPLLPRPTFHRSFAGPGFYSVDTALAMRLRRKSTMIFRKSVSVRILGLHTVHLAHRLMALQIIFLTIREARAPVPYPDCLWVATQSGSSFPISFSYTLSLHVLVGIDLALELTMGV